ncbi:MAG: glycosyltransferase [Myxococcales bacterium]
MTAETIEELHTRHEGKVSDKWDIYLREYQRLMAPIEKAPLSLLEIGVQNGGSLELWAKRFPNARHIIGCDIDPACAALTFDDPRIKVIVIDANTDEAQRRIAQYSESFDVIIDDGSHTSGDIVRSFARYFPMLNDGGLYVIEDLHCSYRSDFEGGLHYPFSSMAFLKRLADVVNHEHWGVHKARADVLRATSEHFHSPPNEESLAHIHSVEFINSLCIIRKERPADNLLGERRITGREAAVNDKVCGPLSAISVASDESSNPWTASALLPEEELLARRSENAELREQHAHLEQAKAAMESEFARRIVALEEQLGAKGKETDELQETFQDERAQWRSALSERDRQLADSAATLTAFLATSRRAEEHACNERDSLRRRIHELEGELNSSKKEVAELQESLSWRITEPLRTSTKTLERFSPPGGYERAMRRVRKVLRQQGMGGATKRMLDLAAGRSSLAPAPKPKPKQKAQQVALRAANADYMDWLRRNDTLGREERAGFRALIPSFAQRPLISLILPIHDPDLARLSETVQSVREQIYPYWELWVVNNASTRTEVKSYLKQLADADPRVRVLETTLGPKAMAMNDGIQHAQGHWTVFLGDDDIVQEHALYWLVEAINLHPDCKLVYSDEDVVDHDGARNYPRFKSDFNPDLFLSYDMVGQLAAYRTDLLHEVGGAAAEREDAELYDLNLRCVEHLVPAREVHHVPRVLYSRRAHPGTARSMHSGKRALEAHFARSKVEAIVEVEAGAFRVTYDLPKQLPLVSIIIPTRNAEGLVRQCVESLMQKTSYPALEILLVDNGSDDPSALAYFDHLAATRKVRLIRDDNPFNYSALNNRAAQLARGELLCLLNNDVEIMSPDWLTEMVSVALQPGVGAVGARLWYPNDTLQHAGVFVGVNIVAAHGHRGLRRSQRGYLDRAALRQTLSAVTAACLVVRKSVFEEVGGLNEVDLKVAFNDVDFCLRLREAGYRNVWTPYAELYHHESASRGQENTPEKAARLASEADFMLARWAIALRHDPAYSPNLTDAADDFGWAWWSRLPRLHNPSQLS